MSRFFVGQRVRVKFAHTPAGAPCVGREAVINDIIELKFVGYGLDISPIEWDGEMWRCWAADQLEPILPEGAAPSEFTTLADLLTSLEESASVPA